MASKSHTEPREFLRKLRDDALVPQVRIFGMVKTQEDDSDHLLFSQTCGDWVSIPVSVIQKIEHLSSAPCKDHSHPVVGIFFEEPRSDEGKVFSQLLNSYRPPQQVRSGSSLCSECLAKCRGLPPEEVFTCLFNCKDCPGIE